MEIIFQVVIILIINNVICRSVSYIARMNYYLNKWRFI